MIPCASAARVWLAPLDFNADAAIQQIQSRLVALPTQEERPLHPRRRQGRCASMGTYGKADARVSALASPALGGRKMLPSSASQDVWSKVSNGTFRLHCGVFNGLCLENRDQSGSYTRFRILKGRRGFTGPLPERPVISTPHRQRGILLPDHDSDSPEFSQRSPLYLLDPGTKHDAPEFVQSKSLEYSASTSLIISLRQPIYEPLNSFTKTFIRKRRAVILLWSVGLISGMNTANEKY